MPHPQITEALGRLQQSIQGMQQMASGNHIFSNQIQDVAQSVQGISTQISSLSGSGNGNKQQVEGIRQQLAQVRRDLHKLTDEVERAQSPLVNTYRTSLGAAKDQFEQASPSQQQTMNLTAYQSLQTYRQEEQLLDRIRQVNAHLMDLSHQVEQLTYSSQIPAPTYGKPADFTNDPGPGFASD